MTLLTCQYCNCTYYTIDHLFSSYNLPRRSFAKLDCTQKKEEGTDQPRTSGT